MSTLNANEREFLIDHMDEIKKEIQVCQNVIDKSPQTDSEIRERFFFKTRNIASDA